MEYKPLQLLLKTITGITPDRQASRRRIERAESSARAAGLANVEVRKGDATLLPVDSGSVDVVTTNGVINLVPEKQRAFQEILRVLKPGGRLHLADILLDVELSEDARQNIDLWTG